MAIFVRNKFSHYHPEPDCCTNWLEHWKAVVEDHSPFCGHAHCLNRASEAILVCKDLAVLGPEYIIPVCPSHKQATGPYPTLTFLISPLPHKTCGRVPLDHQEHQRHMELVPAL